MQPLFQASGWALPNTIVTESNKKKNKASANTEDVSTKKISKEADLLQAEFNKLKPHEKKNKGKKQNKRSRQEEVEEEKGTKNENNNSNTKNNVSKKQKLNQDQQGNNNKNKLNKPAERQLQQQLQKQEPVKKDNQKQQPEQQEQQQQKKKNRNKKNKQASGNNQETHVIPPSSTTNDTPKKNQPKGKASESNENDKKKNTLDANKKNKLKALLEKQKKVPSNDQPQPKDKIKKQQNNDNITSKVSNTTTPEKGLTPLQQKMKDKLSGARFRWLNEKLYTTEGNEAYTLFQDQPELFDEYHEGFRHQVESWPENPVDVILDQLKETPEGTVVADLGCGDAIIGHTLTKQKVLSFDLIAKNDKVIACDITKLPLPANFVDIAVFSLSLMGTNYFDFLTEAHRILKPGGELKIAEVVSRFSDVDGFIDLVESIGFDFIEKDDGNKMFVMFYFTKKENLLAMNEAEDEMLQGLTKKQKRQLQKGAGGKVNTTTLKKKSQKLLKPCLYKRR